jgi:hypothetical protein
MAAGSPLRATAADAPAASTLERPAALFCSAGPGLVQVGRALVQRTRGPPRGVQHTKTAASAAGECRLGRYRGQRGHASLIPFTACSIAQNHKRARRVPSGAGQWLQWAVTGATCNTGCSVAAQTSRVLRVPPVSTQSTPYAPVRALSRAASGAHGYARRGGAVSGVGAAPSAGFRLGVPYAARTQLRTHPL